MTVLGSEKHTNANYIESRLNCWSRFIRAYFVDKWILVCLELCTHGSSQGHGISGIMLMSALHRIQLHFQNWMDFCPISRVLFLFVASCFPSRTVTFSVWCLIILSECLKSSYWQIYSQNCKTHMKQKSKSNHRCMFIRISIIYSKCS